MRHRSRQKLRAELIERYGELTFTRALEMSGLRCCLQALATDHAEPDRARGGRTRRRACISRELQATIITPQECAAK
jgi:hypothetical protein